MMFEPPAVPPFATTGVESALMPTERVCSDAGRTCRPNAQYG
jgi:hypothetical protein